MSATPELPCPNTAPASNGELSVATVLAIDYGARRTGLAIGQTLTRQSQPLKTLEHSWNKPDWVGLDKILQCWQPNLVLIGYPQTLDVAKKSQANIGFYINRFHKQFQERYPIESRLIDESYTSAIARSTLKERRINSTMTRPIRRTDIDAEAASIILDIWFSQMSDSAIFAGDKR